MERQKIFQGKIEEAEKNSSKNVGEQKFFSRKNWGTVKNFQEKIWRHRKKLGEKKNFQEKISVKFLLYQQK